MNTSSLHGIPPLFHIPVFLLCFWSVATALGYRLLRFLNVPREAFGPWETGVVSAAIGAGLLQYIPFTLAAAGHMTATALRVATIALAVVLTPDLVRIYRRVWLALKETAQQRPTPRALIWGALLVLVLAPVLARALVFRSLGDDDGYHLSGPKRWLEAASLIYLPTYTHTNAAVGFEMLYVICLAVWNAIAAKALHFSAGILALLGVYLCGQRLGSKVVGALAISLVMLPTPIYNVSWVLPLAFVDLGACCMTVASVLAWLAWRQSPDRRLLLCVALCAGLAGSMKMTYVAVSLAWFVVLTVELVRVQWRTAASTLFWFGLLALVPVLPWLGRNWWCTGNPFYPMFSGVFPTRDWSAEQATVFERYIHYYSWGIRSNMALGTRKLLILAVAGAVLCCGLVTMRCTKQRSAQYLALFATAFIVPSLLLTGLFFRYLLPAIFALSLVVAAELNQRLARWPNLRWDIAIVLAALTGADYFRRPPELAADMRVALGMSSVEAEQSDDSFWPMWRYINEKTPADAKVMMAAFYTTFGASSFGNFFVDRRCYTTDSHLQTFIPFDAWSTFLHSLSQSGIEYVVIADRQFQPGRHGFVFRGELNEYAFCRRLADEFGEKLVQYDHLQLYRVRVTEAEQRLGERVAGAPAH